MLRQLTEKWSEYHVVKNVSCVHLSKLLSTTITSPSLSLSRVPVFISLRFIIILILIQTTNQKQTTRRLKTQWVFQPSCWGNHFQDDIILDTTISIWKLNWFSKAMAATTWVTTAIIATTATTDVWQQTATETATVTTLGATAAILQLSTSLKQQPKPWNLSLIFHLYKLYNKRLSCFTSLFNLKLYEITMKKLKGNTLIEAKVRLQTAGQLLITTNSYWALWWFWLFVVMDCRHF